MATSAAATIYRKTTLGQIELTQRRAGLSPRARAVLVMVNGKDTAASLVERLGAEVPGVLRQLVELGLIELATATGAAPESVGAKLAVAAPAAAATPAPASVQAGHDAALLAAEASAATAGPTPSTLLALVQLLLPHFGPDATRVADAALRAASHVEFNTALDSVAARLAIHLGRKQADQLLAPLRQPAV